MVTLRLISSLIAITAHRESCMADKLLTVLYCSVCKHVLRRFQGGIENNIFYLLGTSSDSVLFNAYISVHWDIYGAFQDHILFFLKLCHGHGQWISPVWLFCNPTDCGLPGSSVRGVLQARLLEWVAVSSSRRSSWPRDRTSVSFCLLHWQADSLALGHMRSPCY